MIKQIIKSTTLARNVFVSEDASVVLFNTVQYSSNEEQAILAFQCSLLNCQTC